MKSERQLFHDAGQAFKNAREILEDGCVFPPSFDVFCAELKDMRRRSPTTTPEIAARNVAANYSASNFFRYPLP